MDDKKPSVSPETQKFLDDLQKEKERLTPKPRDFVPPKTAAERFKEWVQFAPAPVVFLCKILKFILDVGGFIFILVGGVVMLVSAWKILQAIDASGWRGLLDWPTLYVAGYFAAMFIINKLRWLMYRIVNGI